MNTAEKLERHQDLYLEDLQELSDMYLYTPTFALAFNILFSRLSLDVVELIHTLGHVAAYVVLYFSWRRIFQRLGLTRAAKTLAGTLPLWLVYYPFWNDMNWLNIHVFIALGVTFLVDALLQEQLGRSVVWTTLLLLAKPQWAVVIILPLALSRWRFFAKLAAQSVVSYLVITSLTILALGPEYGLEQHYEYVRFLTVTMREAWLWRSADQFVVLGPNHSIDQVFYYIGAMGAVLVIKLLLLSPLGVVSFTLARGDRPKEPSLVPYHNSASSRLDCGRCSLCMPSVMFSGHWDICFWVTMPSWQIPSSDL